MDKRGVMVYWSVKKLLIHQAPIKGRCMLVLMPVSHLLVPIFHDLMLIYHLLMLNLGPLMPIISSCVPNSLRLKPIAHP